jgi:hypothetical protein
VKRKRTQSDVGAKTISVTARATGPDARLSIVFAGDTSFGENYQEDRERRGKENILKSRGYDYTLANFVSTLAGADLAIVNLETPVTNLKNSPFAGQKSYIHYADVKKTPNQLWSSNIRAVSLANNHSFDFGAEGFEQTLRVLGKKGIVCFGAGRDRKSASEPLLVRAAIGSLELRLAVFAAYGARKKALARYDCAATADKGGLAGLSPRRIRDRIRSLKADDPALIAIAFPHWGSNYAWRSERQSRLANEFLDAGIDLILGHGAHMLQEVEWRDGRWVVFSLGNFVFNAPGRYKLLNAPPFSFLAKLLAEPDHGRLAVCVRLYPIVTDNKRTDYQSRFVTDGEFVRVLEVLESRSANTGPMHFGRDNTGCYLGLPVRQHGAGPD